MKLCKDCRNKGKKRMCEFQTAISSYAEMCKDFEPKRPTNADRIRFMSDEELAELLDDICTNGILAIDSNMPCDCCTEKTECKDCWKEWLRSETEEQNELL